MCLTRKEKKLLIRQKENWQAFSNLLARAIGDLGRSTKFDETCEIIENFVYLSRQLFGDDDEKISRLIDKLASFVDDARRHMNDIDRKIKPLIESTVDEYNSRYNGDLVFDGDVEQWFNRTFPLVVLYVNRNLKEGDGNE